MAAILRRLVFLLLDQFSSFSTVDEFLRAASAAKAERLQAVSDSISPHLDDHGTVGLPPALAQTIEGLLEQHGDEVYRQVALFALGKWFELHVGMSEEHFANDNPEFGASAIMDATRISDALHLLAELRSFGGSQSWKEMLNETLSQFILENIEEHFQP